MSGAVYVGTAERTFRQTLIHLLESDYRILGSGRILELLAEDIEHLVDEFCPAAERLRPGWMLFTGTKGDDHKPYPGETMSAYTLVTLAWPVLTVEDLQQLTNLPETKEARQGWLQQRLIRIVEHGLSQPGGEVLLTLADLAAMLGLTTVQVSQLLTAARQQSGKALPTKGYHFDQGMRPTHKEEIIALYETGVDEADIARRTGHAATSVGRYIRDYERVKLLLRRGLPAEQISALIEMQPSVVLAYVAMLQRYHPELLSSTAVTVQT